MILQVSSQHAVNVNFPNRLIVSLRIYPLKPPPTKLPFHFIQSRFQFDQFTNFFYGRSLKILWFDNKNDVGVWSKCILSRGTMIDHTIEPNHKIILLWINKLVIDLNNKKIHTHTKEEKAQTNKQAHILQYLFVIIDMDSNQLAVMEYVLFVLYIFYANCMQIKFVYV